MIGRIGIPGTIGLSVCLSLVATYLPLLLSRYTSSAALIGLAIGGEGLFALAIPLVVGSLSDRVWTRWGRRRPFMILGAPVMAAAIFLAPFQPGYLPIAATLDLPGGLFHRVLRARHPLGVGAPLPTFGLGGSLC